MTIWLTHLWSALRASLGLHDAARPLTPAHGWLLPVAPPAIVPVLDPAVRQ